MKKLAIGQLFGLMGYTSLAIALTQNVVQAETVEIAPPLSSTPNDGLSLSVSDPSINPQPVEPNRGPVLTSADALGPTPTSSPLVMTAPTPLPAVPGQPESTPTVPLVSQQVNPGRRTRSGSSYVGVGGNIGLGDGDTAVGEGSLAVFSKIGLTRSLSVRPGIFISDSPTILLPITYDFSIGAGPTRDVSFSAAPFVGAGPALSTGDDTSVNLLLTGGVDIPLSRQFTATASVNATVIDDPAVGILLGIGYNFSGF